MSSTLAPRRTVPNARKARGQGPTRRPEILAAAKHLFVTEGYERATMRRIAAEVGVSATALYVYFSDKEAILRAIAEATFTDMLAALHESQRGPGCKLERLRAGLRTYVEFGVSRPDEYRLTFGAKRMDVMPGRQTLGCFTIEAAGRSFEILQRGILDLMNDGVFARGDDVLAAEAVWACLHGATIMLLDLRPHILNEPAPLTCAVLDIIIGGLTSPLLREQC